VAEASQRPSFGAALAERRPTLVYIASMSHAGSTLLDLLVSGHSEIVSVGEVKQLVRTPRRARCSCGAESPAACPFWTDVDRRLKGHGAPGLEALDVRGTDPARFSADNLALLKAVGQASGRRFIVDSSKNPRRLAYLLSDGGLDLRVIHLLRHPCGVAFSHARKGRSPVVAAAVQTRKTLYLRWLLRRTPHLEIRYEQLADAPAATLGRVMGWLGLAMEPGQLDFAGRERHNLGGNRMRFSADSTIARDTRWEVGLTPLQKALVSVVSAPARVPGADSAYALWRWLRRGRSDP